MSNQGIQTWKERTGWDESWGYPAQSAIMQAAEAEIAELRKALEAVDGDKRKLAEMVKIMLSNTQPDSGRDAVLLFDPLRLRMLKAGECDSECPVFLAADVRAMAAQQGEKGGA